MDVKNHVSLYICHVYDYNSLLYVSQEYSFVCVISIHFPVPKKLTFEYTVHKKAECITLVYLRSFSP